MGIHHFTDYVCDYCHQYTDEECLASCFSCHNTVCEGCGYSGIDVLIEEILEKECKLRHFIRQQMIEKENKNESKDNFCVSREYEQMEESIYDNFGIDQDDVSVVCRKCQDKIKTRILNTIYGTNHKDFNNYIAEMAGYKSYKNAKEQFPTLNHYLAHLAGFNDLKLAQKAYSFKIKSFQKAKIKQELETLIQETAQKFQDVMQTKKNPTCGATYWFSQTSVKECKTRSQVQDHVLSRAKCWVLEMMHEHDSWNDNFDKSLL